MLMCWSARGVKVTHNRRSIAQTTAAFPCNTACSPINRVLPGADAAYVTRESPVVPHRQNERRSFQAESETFHNHTIQQAPQYPCAQQSPIPRLLDLLCT